MSRSGATVVLTRPWRLALSRDRALREYFRILRTPVLAWIYVRTRKALQPFRITRHTDLVVDGYPRSANTYLLECLRTAAPDVRVASHLHSPEMVRWAQRRRLPTVVLFREPAPAAASLTQLYTGATFATALNLYRRYYTAVLPRIDSVLLVSFDEAIDDFAGVVRRINQRFGDVLVDPHLDWDDATAAALVERIEDHTRNAAFPIPVHEAMSLPSARRRQAVDFIAEASPRDLRELALCEDLYARLRTEWLRQVGSS